MKSENFAAHLLCYCPVFVPLCHREQASGFTWKLKPLRDQSIAVSPTSSTAKGLLDDLVGLGRLRMARKLGLIIEGLR